MKSINEDIVYNFRRGIDINIDGRMISCRENTNIYERVRMDIWIRICDNTMANISSNIRTVQPKK